MPFKMHQIIFFFQKKKIIKKICVPTLPKMFRPVTRNTLIFLFGPMAPSEIFSRVVNDFSFQQAKVSDKWACNKNIVTLRLSFL